jgi:hypothetical protein
VMKFRQAPRPGFRRSVTAAARAPRGDCTLSCPTSRGAQDDLLRRGVRSATCSRRRQVYAGTDQLLFGRVRVWSDPNATYHPLLVQRSGRQWLATQVPRLPGRIDSNATSFASAEDLARWRAARPASMAERAAGYDEKLARLVRHLWCALPL